MKTLRKATESRNGITAMLAIIAVAVIAGIVAAPALQQQQQAEQKSILVSSTLVPLKVSDLSKDSTHVIVGTVADVLAGPTQYDEKRSTTRAFTDIVINVEQDLAGTYKDSQITVRTLGGMAGDVKVEAENEAKFAKDERVVVFVTRAGNNTVWGDSFIVYGMELGKYNVVDGKAYGPEYPQGVPVDQFVQEIKTYRSTSQ